MIRLFSANETEFTSLGLGNLGDAVSCVVVEERNGSFELSMEYPITGQHYDDIGYRKLIYAKPNPFSREQPFRIYRITKPIDGIVTVMAEHISYDLSGIPVSPLSADTINSAFGLLSTSSIVDNPFTFNNLGENTTGELKTETPASCRSLLGGEDASILSVYKGELEFDRYEVKRYTNRGNDFGVIIEYGKNLTDLTQEENCADVYTGVYPYYYTEESGIVDLSTEVENEAPIDDERVDGKILKCEGNYDYIRILSLDLTNDIQNEANNLNNPTSDDKTPDDDGDYDWDYDEAFEKEDYGINAEDELDKKKIKELLLTQGKKYIEDNKVGTPKVDLTVSFEMLSQYEDYKDLGLLENVHLCDTVTVRFPALGVDSTSKCIKTEYNVILDKYNSVELGENEPNNGIVDTIASHDSAVTPSNGKKSFVEKAIDNATKMITGGAGGYVLIRNSTGGVGPDEILVMSKPDVNDPDNSMWRWNKNGLGFSKTGYNGPYEAAFTSDGQIVADMITAGTMLANRIHGGTLFMGGKENGNGEIYIVDEEGKEYGKINKNGIELTNNAEEKQVVNMTAGINQYKWLDEKGTNDIGHIGTNWLAKETQWNNEVKEYDMATAPKGLEIGLDSGDPDKFIALSAKNPSEESSNYETFLKYKWRNLALAYIRSLLVVSNETGDVEVEGEDVQLKRGLTVTLPMTQVITVNDNGTIKSYCKDCYLEFNKGILTEYRWNTQKKDT